MNEVDLVGRIHKTLWDSELSNFKFIIGSKPNTISLEDHKVTLRVANNTAYAFVTKRIPLFEKAINDGLNDGNYTVNFVIDESLSTSPENSQTQINKINPKTTNSSITSKIIKLAGKIPEINVDPSTRVIHEGNNIAFIVKDKIVKSVINGESSDSSICFFGPNGAGKTSLLAAMAYPLLKEGIPVGFLSVEELATGYKNHIHDEIRYPLPDLKYMKNVGLTLVDGIEGLVKDGIPIRPSCQKDLKYIIDDSRKNKIPFVCTYVGNKKSLIDFIKIIGTSNSALADRLLEFQTYPVDPPTQGRQEIIKQLIISNGINVKYDDMGSISRYLDYMLPLEDKSFRALLGPIKTLRSYEEVTPQTVRKVLDGQMEIFKPAIYSTVPDPNSVMDVIGELDDRYNVSHIISNKKDRDGELNQLRWTVAYAIDQMCYLSPKSIGKILNRTPQQISNYIKKFEELVDNPQERLKVLSKILNRIGYRR